MPSLSPAAAYHSIALDLPLGDAIPLSPLQWRVR